MNKTLFLSKNRDELAEFSNFCKKNSIDLCAQSLISLKEIETKEKIATEFVFFGSKNAFDFYLKNKDFPTNIKICCVGEATKKHIENLGFKVDFCGENAGNVEEVSKQLNLFLNGSSITFIQSTESKKTIQKHIDSAIIHELVIYETKFESHQFSQDFDFLVFTSPSNVNSFLLTNKINEKSILIAWGKSTEKVLLERGYEANFVLKNSTFEELMELLITFEHQGLV